MRVNWISDRLWAVNASGAQGTNVYSLSGYCFAKTEAEALQKQSAIFLTEHGFEGMAIALEIPIGEITKRMQKVPEQ